MIGNLTDIIIATLGSAAAGFQNYLPRFLAGLVLLLIGLMAAKAARGLVLGLLKALRVAKFLVQIKVVREEGAVKVWEVLLAELARWAMTVLFLIPAAEAWGLSKVTEVLNGLLLYLPNVFVSVIVGLVGFVIANLSYDIIEHSTSGLDEKAGRALGGVAHYSILFFTVLVILSQLGVAADLVRILFTGFVAMMALAGGLAFGLGGKNLAEEILRGLKEKLMK